jgi:hypothetical protein
MADRTSSPGQSQLFVATDFEAWEAHPPIDVDQDEICEESGFRRLDPVYYAWLRHRMEWVKQRHNAGGLKDRTYEALRQRFNHVHGWALQRFGEEALLAAIKESDPQRYAPPKIGGPDELPPVGLLDPPMGPFRFFVRVTRLARVKANLIGERAIALGWTPAQLYQTCGRYHFPMGNDYGLVCFLRSGDEITEVTARYIEVTSLQGVRTRFYKSAAGHGVQG